MPRAGQEPEPQGGGAKDRDGATEALKLESCFFIFLEPQWGQTGWREPVTSSSATSLQEEQMYSNSGMGVDYFAAARASTSTFAWRMPTNSLTFLPSLKMTR